MIKIEWIKSSGIGNIRTGNIRTFIMGKLKNNTIVSENEDRINRINSRRIVQIAGHSLLEFKQIRIRVVFTNTNSSQPLKNTKLSFFELNAAPYMVIKQIKGYKNTTNMISKDCNITLDNDCVMICGNYGSS
jgi:hypothetical protein